MPKTRSQVKEAGKKKQAEVKQYEFKNNPNFTPVSSGDLRHSMKGKQFFYVKFEGKDYTHDKIQRFVQKIATKYHEAKEADYIRVSIDYEFEGYRSSKISKVSEDLNLTFSTEYADIQGKIQGFILYLA